MVAPLFAVVDCLDHPHVSGEHGKEQAITGAGAKDHPHVSGEHTSDTLIHGYCWSWLLAIVWRVVV